MWFSESRYEVNSIYTYFSKPFYKFNNSVLLQKLKAYVVSGNMTLWFESYLMGKIQHIKLGAYYSPVFELSGVSQRSVLDPLLFSICINNVTANFDCNYFLFADDLKLINKMK